MLTRLLRVLLFGSLLCGAGLGAQAPDAKASGDAFAALKFLEGTWSAHGTGQGATADGVYAFKRELGGHVLARHSGGGSACNGPEGFDCDHRDLLYVYADAAGEPMKAIYFDNEGHVIHYDVTTPEPEKVVFLSEASASGPRFRLMYSLRGGVMSGSFAMQPPGQTAWHVYLEWSGGKE